MAKINQENTKKEREKENEKINSEVNIEETKKEDEDLVKELQAQIEQLKQQLAKKEVEETKTEEVSKVEKETAKEDTTTKLLEYLTNKKSDKEIVIIHNRERLGGLATSIRLTGLSIDFHTLGEQRVLNWQQFEECVSKYYKWFQKRIILLAPEFKELAEKYNVPYVKDNNKEILTRNDLGKIGKMPIDELEKYYLALGKEDRDFFCSYWLGKCYEKEPGFYDRYKIELLNRLSRNGSFDNLLITMNYDFKETN